MWRLFGWLVEAEVAASLGGAASCFALRCDCVGSIIRLLSFKHLLRCIWLPLRVHIALLPKVTGIALRLIAMGSQVSEVTVFYDAPFIAHNQ